MEIAPNLLPRASIYKILIGSVVPRPIGWISTVDEAGNPNLAPFSFFTVVCAKPPTVLFCPMIRSTDENPKDTLNNVKATGEFVVNIVTEELAPAMIATSVEIASAVNEFELAGLRDRAVSCGQATTRGREPHSFRVQADPNRGDREQSRGWERCYRRDRPFARGRARPVR